MQVVFSLFFSPPSGTVYFLLSSDPLRPPMPSSRGKHLRIAETCVAVMRRLGDSLTRAKQKREFAEAEIAKLHRCLFFNCLKLFDSSRVNPLQKYIFMCCFFSLHLWLLFPLNAFLRTADSNCHPREDVDIYIYFFGYSKIIIK